MPTENGKGRPCAEERAVDDGDGWMPRGDVMQPVTACTRVRKTAQARVKETRKLLLSCHRLPTYGTHD